MAQAMELTEPAVLPLDLHDRIAVKLLTIVWGNLDAPVAASYAFSRYGYAADGTRSELPGGLGQRRMADLYAVAKARAEAGKPKLADAIAAVLDAIAEIEGNKVINFDWDTFTADRWDHFSADEWAGIVPTTGDIVLLWADMWVPGMIQDDVWVAGTTQDDTYTAGVQKDDTYRPGLTQDDIYAEANTIEGN